MNKTKIDNYYKPESKTLRLDEIVYTMIPNSDIKPLLDKLQQENEKLKERIEYLEGSNNRRENTILEQRKEISNLEDNWNKLKEYLINDINNRNGTKIAEFEDGNRVSETISSIYTLMEDRSKTIKEVLDKMQELEQGSDSKWQN